MPAFLTDTQKITNINVFSKCEIEVIYIFNATAASLSWLCCAHWWWKDLEILMRCQLSDGSWKVGRSPLRYKDKLKQNQHSIQIPLSSFEEVASDCVNSVSGCIKDITAFKQSRITGQNSEHKTQTVCYSLSYFWKAVLVSSWHYSHRRRNSQVGYQRWNMLLNSHT